MRLLDRILGRRSNVVVREHADDQHPQFAVIDVETTGLSPDHDRVLELAIVRLDAHAGLIDEWTTRFDPQRPVGATHIHGIRQQDVRGEPTFDQVAPTIVKALGGLAVVAHNATFDLAFLRAEFRAAGWTMPMVPAYCTLEASHVYLPGLPRRRLMDCCDAVHRPVTGAHSALGDARSAAALFQAYAAMNRGTDARARHVVAEARSLTWPVRPSSPPRPTQPARDRSAASPPHPHPTSRWRYTPPRPKQPALVHQLAALGLDEVLEEGAPATAVAYLELLLEALGSGALTDGGTPDVAGLSVSYGLGPEHVVSVHEALMSALAHRAVDDGHVSRAERAELKTIAALLGVAEARVNPIIRWADAARLERLATGLGPLPADWAHGEPLRVGHRVVFTGCDPDQRDYLEQRSTDLGIRVIGSVSGLTDLLVTDGSFSGVKLARATELGTRLVHPDVYETLLEHLQPGVPAGGSALGNTRAVAAAHVNPPC